MNVDTVDLYNRHLLFVFNNVFYNENLKKKNNLIA